MLRCLIVDDNKMARTALKQLAGKVDFIELAGECESPEEAFSILQKGDIDLVFLDVEMPGMTGLDLVRSISSRPMIILITAKRDYAVEAYELNVVDYLVKPVQLPRFLASVNRARELKESRSRQVDTVDVDYIFVRAGGVLTKIRLEEILYIQALGDYVTIFTTDKRYTVHVTLRVLEERLPAARFFRLHRSYIAALDHIDTVEENTAYIHGNPVPVGEQLKPALLRRLNLI